MAFKIREFIKSLKHHFNRYIITHIMEKNNTLSKKYY